MANVNNVLCIHHGDMDGYMAARVVYEYLLKGGSDGLNVDFVVGNYSKKSPHLNIIHDDEKLRGYDSVYILDYSLDLEDMKNLQNFDKHLNITWIDHHKTSFDMWSNWMEENPEWVNIPGIRTSGGLCGAELTYLYLFRNFYNDSPFDNTIQCDGLVDGELFTYDMDNTTAVDSVEQFIPPVLRTVGRWDTWRWERLEDQGPSYLNLGYLLDETHTDVKSSMYEGLLNEDISSNFSDMINAGKYVSKWLTGNNSMNCKRNSFECDIIGFEDYRTIAINSTMGSSKIFESIHEEYEIGIVYNYTGNNITRYSFYRLGLNPTRDIDCGEIAKSFGGGGHPGAAGCVIQSNIDVFKER